MNDETEAPMPAITHEEARTTIDQELDADIKELYATRSKMLDEQDAEGGLMPEDQRTLRLANMAIDILERCERDRRPEPHDYKMMFEVAEEKLNEYIDKTVEAERDARKNFESYERIRDKYSAEVNEHRESNARVGVLEARLEEAEKRAEAAEREVALLRAALEYPPDNSTQYRCAQLDGLLREERACKAHEVEQARQEGYERGKAEKG